jgi:hypothetical protein
MTKIRVMPSMALRIMVKYCRKATMTPLLISPLLTRKAPMATTAVRPKFSTRVEVGLVMAVMKPAF